MHVCHVLEASGGVGNVVIDLARLGVAAGQDVTVIYAPNRATENFVATMMAMPGLKLIALPMERAVGVHDVVDVARLYLCLRGAGPFDIIHLHSSKAGALGRIAGFFFPRAVKIYTPHAFMTLAPGASPVYGWIEWLLSWFNNVIVCTSEQEKRHAIDKLKIRASILRVIPNGVELNYPTDRAKARAELGFGDADFVVGFVGRFVPQKNPPRLVTAFAAAAQQRPELCLAMIGDGPLRTEAERAFAAKGLTPHVRFKVSSYARDYMPAFDCLLCSSDYESFGLVLLEAMAAGVPVVTTPVGIAEEAVIPGKTGYISAGFDARVLTDGILALAAVTPDKRAEMAAACKGRARDFSVESMAERTWALYSELIARRAGS